MLNLINDVDLEIAWMRKRTEGVLFQNKTGGEHTQALFSRIESRISIKGPRVNMKTQRDKLWSSFVRSIGLYLYIVRERGFERKMALV